MSVVQLGCLNGCWVASLGGGVGGGGHSNSYPLQSRRLGQRFCGDSPWAPEFERRRRRVLEHVRGRTVASRMPLNFARSGFFKSRPGILESPFQFMQVKCLKVLRAHPATTTRTPAPSVYLRGPRNPQQSWRKYGPPLLLLHTLSSPFLSFRPSLSSLPSFFPSISHLSFYSLLPRPLFFPPTSTIVHPLSFCDSGCLKRSVCLQGWMIDSRERARQLSGDR